MIRLIFERFENANQGNDFNPSLGLEAYQNANRWRVRLLRLVL